MNVQVIKQQLTDLRLHTAASSVAEVIGAERKTIHLEWLAELLSREIGARRERAIQVRIKRANFPEVTSLEEFDWDFNKDIDRGKVEALANLDFVRQRRIALLLGKPGTGKTHIALSLGLRAAQHGMRVYCTSVKRLCGDITVARAHNRLDVLFKRILSSHLWIFDDWGLTQMKSEVSEEIFDLLDRRKQSTALVLTSNRAVDEWPQVFPDRVLAAAALDRLFDRAEVITFEGESYRLRGKIKVRDFDFTLRDES
jgi:DNA replication protein DnaC